MLAYLSLKVRKRLGKGRAVAVITACTLLFACSYPHSESPLRTAMTEATMYPKRPDLSPERTPAPSTVETFDVNSYEITARVDDSNGRLITGAERVLYKNRSGKELSKIYFNLYINGFRSTADVKPYFDDQAARVFGVESDKNVSEVVNENAYGYIVIDMVTQSSEALRYSISGTALEATLAKPLEPGDTASITLKFTIKMPRVNHRIGTNEQEMWGSSVFPSVAVLEDGWHTEPVYPGQRKALRDISNYNVRFITPAKETVVGNSESTYTINSDERETVFSSKLARGFPFAISSDFSVTTQTLDSGLKINLYTINDSDKAESIMRSAVKSIEYFSKLIAPYASQTISIVETKLYAKTAEATSGIVFIDSELIESGDFDFEVAAAIASFWFGGVVGFDPVKDPWLSEGLRSFLADKQVGYMKTWKLSWRAALTQRLEASEKIMKTDLSEFSSSGEFTDVCRYKSMLMLSELESIIGKDVLEQAIRRFYEVFSMGIATEADFINCVEEISNEDLTNFFNKWLKQTGLPDPEQEKGQKDNQSDLKVQSTLDQ